MIIEEKGNYLHISSDDDTLNDFINSFKEEHSILENKNLIISISDNFKATEENIFVFFKYAQLHKENGTTFVIVCNNLNVDNFPEEFNIVPTLQEAEDVLEMENIERDLGF